MGPARMRTGRPQPPRGLWGQLRALVLKPGFFFHVLPGGQTWLVVALLLIALTGISEFQRQNRLAAVTGESGNGGVEMPVDMGMVDSGKGGVSGGGFEGGGLGDTPLPPPDAGGGGVPPGGESNITGDLSKVLVAGTGIVVVWGINVALLSLVTLMNGFAPNFSRSLRIAIWATVPLGLMAVFQLIYYAAGGKAGEPGLVGLLDEWDGYTTAAPLIQSLLLAVAARLTIFYFWTAALLYIGARNALRGKRLAAGFAVVVWTVLVIALPVLTGAIAAPAKNDDLPPLLELPNGEMPVDTSIMPGEDMLPEDAMTGTVEAGGETPMTTEEAPVETEAVKPENPPEGGKPGKDKSGDMAAAPLDSSNAADLPVSGQKE